MKTSELIKELKRKGCKLHRHGKSHDLWISPAGKTIIVPRHKHEVPSGTASSILKEAQDG